MAVVEVVLGLIDDERPRVLRKKEREDGNTSLSRRKVLKGHEPSLAHRKVPGIAEVEWDVALTREDVWEGAQAVVFRRVGGREYGEPPGELEQRIDATPWRGQRVTLRASVRVEAVTAGNRGHLWLMVTRPSEFWSERVFYDAMLERPITSPEWREYEITADVPEDADVTAYGFAIVGTGRAWLDAVSLMTRP